MTDSLEEAFALTDPVAPEELIHKLMVTDAKDPVAMVTVLLEIGSWFEQQVPEEIRAEIIPQVFLMLPMLATLTRDHAFMNTLGANGIDLVLHEGLPSFRVRVDIGDRWQYVYLSASKGETVPK
jgi:hypothetical protein